MPIVNLTERVEDNLLEVSGSREHHIAVRVGTFPLDFVVKCTSMALLFFETDRLSWFFAVVPALGISSWLSIAFFHVEIVLTSIPAVVFKV